MTAWLSVVLVGVASALRAPPRCSSRHLAPQLCAYEAMVGPLPAALGDSLPLLIGPVATGFGRGSRKLGIPTANLPCSLFQEQLAELPCGVYLGWAKLQGGVHKCVCNVGFSPTFEGAENPEKIVEAHLMEEFESDFYGETMSLLLLGFIRPERKFGGIDELLATIRADIAAASEALEGSPYVELGALVGAIPPPRGKEGSFTLLEVPAGLLDAPSGAGRPSEDGNDAFGGPPPPAGFEWGFAG